MEVNGIYLLGKLHLLTKKRGGGERQALPQKAGTKETHREKARRDIKATARVWVGVGWALCSGMMGQKGAQIRE